MDCDDILITHKKVTMSTKRGKLKSANKGRNIHETGDWIVDDDQGSLLSKAFSGLSIRLEPEDDFPHPRHLCFAYPFGKSSPKRHCSKCYCYVCEKVAPCKYWKKHPNRHCDATERLDKWVRERTLNKRLSGRTTMLCHKLIVSGTFNPSDGPFHLPGDEHVYGGALICRKDGGWVFGVSMHLYDNTATSVDIRVPLVPLYRVLLEGLQLAWTQGFRCLEVKLGCIFHKGFWHDFTEDAVTRKFRVHVDAIDQAFAILKEVEDYLNREWFIDVKNTEEVVEERGAVDMISLAYVQDQAKEVHDFRSHPFAEAAATETRNREFADLARLCASNVFDFYDCLDYDAPSAEIKKYYGID